MTIKPLSEFSNVLYGCRFCPMCKPAAEVANITLIESHTTRARAMLLWRVVQGMTDFSARDAELLFQSTLDSISQAWCVHHYPVSEYVVSARYEVLKRGGAPEAVQQVLNTLKSSSIEMHGEVIYLAAEEARMTIHQKGTGGKGIGSSPKNLPVDRVRKEADGEIVREEFQKTIDRALALLKAGSIEASPVTAGTGFLELSLGAVQQAAERARLLVDAVQRGGVKKIITDGPETLWMVRCILPALDAPLPENVIVVSLAEELSGMVQKGVLKAASKIKGSRVFFHDSRSACLLADELASDRAILPDFSGPEELLGTGAVYDIPRSILDSLGVERVFSVWSRSLSKSCGIEGGLWVTYPDLAENLSKKRLEEAKELGAGMIVSDSPFCVRQLRCVQENDDPEVRWLPELLGYG